MNKLTIDSICDFSNAFGPSGMENEVLKTAEQFIENGYELSTDSIKNLYIAPLHRDPDKTAVLLDAHSDEVGFMVQSILDNGCLSFLPLGGWDAKNIISCPVKIRTWAKGDISGIVSSIPPHFNNGENKTLEISDLQIDVGACSKEECEKLGIAPGDFIVPDVTCLYDETREIFIGKAFDCRIGCAALIQTLNELQKENISCNVMGVLSAQEEVGDRGISCAVEKIKKDFNPSYAICFEGCPADDTFVSKDRIQTALKKGPMIRFFDRSMITSPEYMHLAIDTAKENNIPLQTAVRKGGGTNGGILHLHDIPTIVIGIPVRYAHASMGYCSKTDFENAVALAIAVIKKLENR